MPKTPEDRFKARILDQLNGIGGYWIATPRSRFGKAGTPDIIGCFNGEFVAIEVKRPDKKGYAVTPTQARVLEIIRGNDGLAWVIDSEQALEYALETLRSIRYTPYTKGWNAPAGGQKCATAV